MPDKNKQFTAFDFIPMPPPPTDELIEVERTRFWRHKTAKAIGALIIGGLVVANPIAKIDHAITMERYQADDIEIIQAAGAEEIPKGGTEWLVFGGYGQKYSTNAAQELFNALGGKEVVASVKYPNQEFSIEDLASEVSDYMNQRGMSKLNVAGVSMGTPTALMTLSYIQEHAKAPYVQYQTVDYANSDLSLRKLPEIGYFAAYSSPADLQDASQGSLAQKIVTSGEALDYSPGILGKFIFSAFDGDGDTFRTLNVFDARAWLGQMKDTLKQTFNETPPTMVWSQMKIIAKFSADKQWEGWRNVLSPQTQFGYFYPSQTDPTVNDHNAYQKYAIALRNLNVPVTFVPTGEPGHANTVASAAAVSEWIASLTATALAQEISLNSS